MGYQSDYARTVADIYSQLGQGQAQARLQQGSAWANAFGQIGQTVAAIPGQMQDQKNAEAQRLRMAQQDARLVTQDQLAATERDEKMFLRNAIASSMGKDGRVDHTLLQENLQKMGVGHIAADATQVWQQMETGWLALQHGITQGITDQAALGKLRDDYLGPPAVQWQNAQPGLERDSIVEAALLNLESKGLTQQAQELRATLKDDPKVFNATLNGLAQRYKPKPNVTNVPQGGALVNEDTGEVVYRNPNPPAVASLEDYVTQLYGPRPTPAQIASARRSYGEAGRPPTVNVNAGPEPVAPPSDVSSQDIMSQAGLSRMGYLSLTNPTSIPRDQATRTRAAKEVAAWARARGIDTSTFETKFKAYNKVLSNNIMRLNTVQNIELDLQGTIQNLQNAATEAGMTDVTAVNAMKLWLAGNLNDPSAINYATNLEALVSDIARYNSSSSSPDGDRNPLDADMTAARNLLKRGISSGGLAGVLKAVNASVANMDKVNKTAVTRAEKAVWTLFGVGDKYQPKTNDPMEIRR